MQYIAALDYEHLDNGMFLNSFARALSQQQDVQPVIVHGDSAYTERIIQTGVMRDEALVRSIKDLNHRLVALFADQGISAIGMNGYQREMVTMDKGKLILNRAWFDRLPRTAVLLISNLVLNIENKRISPVPLPDFARFLQVNLEKPDLFIFSASDSGIWLGKEKNPSVLHWDKLDKSFMERYIPKEFREYKGPLRLATAREFQQTSSLNKVTIIR